MSAKVYGDGAGLYGDISTTYVANAWSTVSETSKPIQVYDTNEVVGATVENTNTQKSSSVLETLREVLHYHESRGRPNKCSWMDLPNEGPGIMGIVTDYWQQAFDAMQENGAVETNLVAGYVLDLRRLKDLISMMEQDEKPVKIAAPHHTTDREIYAMLSALELYQKKLRSQSCTEPGWQKMKGKSGLDAMNIDHSESNLQAWDAAWSLFYYNSRFMGGTSWRVWDQDLELLDDILWSLRKSMACSYESSSKVVAADASEAIEEVPDKAEVDYYPSKEGMVLGYPTIIECRAQSPSITTDIATLREQLDDIFKQSIKSGPSPDVAAACLIEPMIGEYADLGIEIAQPLIHILSQLRVAGKNPIRYASWMACSGLVAQAKALVKPHTPRPDGCTLFEYQSTLKKLAEVAK